MLDTAKLLIRGNPWAFGVWYAGLTEEERQGLEAALGLNAVQRACEALTEVFEGIREAIVAFCEAIVEWVKEFYPILFEPRYRLLRRWHVPHWLALWLAQRCSRQWLPPPGLACGEG